MPLGELSTRLCLDCSVCHSSYLPETPGGFHVPNSITRRVPPNTSRAGWLLLIALIPFLVLAAYHWSWGAPPGFGDHAQYLSHARALVEGRGYTEIGYIYHPAAPMLGPRAYPPGLPLTLAPLVALGGYDSWLIRACMIATLLLFAYLAYRRLVLAMAPWQAALGVGLTALAIEIQYGSIVPLSDPGFCALVWGAILAADTAHSWTWRRVALVTALGFGAMAYRLPGVVVVPALVMHALLTWRDHRGRAMIPAFVWGIAGGLALLSGRVALPFQAHLFPSLADFLERLTNIARVYRASVFDLELYPFPTGPLNDAYHLAVSIPLLLGTAALLWRYRRSMLTWFVIAYVAMLIVSPAIDGRYLWPLYPVLAGGLLLGLTALWRGAARLVRARPHPAPVAAALGLVLLTGVWRALQAAPPRSLDRDPDALALFDWLQTHNAREPMRVAFHNPRVLTLRTRVPAMGGILATPSAHIRALRDVEITHIIWQKAETNACRARLLNALPREFPTLFSVDYENPTFRVYRLNRTGDIPPDSWGNREITSDACRALPPA